MAVTMAEISKLRQMTGAGMMDCKKALAEAENDMDKAIEILRKKGQAVAAKREDRNAAEGCVLGQSTGEYAAVVALNCETDFVAKNAGFVNLTKSILAAAVEAKAKSLDEVKALEINGQKIADLIVDESGKTGEKMELGAFEYVEAPATVAYNHFGNKLATLVAFNKAGIAEQVYKNVAMQVAAMNPIAASRDEVPAEVVAQELEVAKGKAREEGKKEEMLDRIAEGRLNKFYKETVLMEQEYHRDAKLTVAQYLDGQSKGMVVTAFRRVNLNQD
jgi:elongation factor Ts